MNGSPTSPVSTPTAAPLARELDTARIDASCRALLVPIVSALLWLVISSVLLLVTSVKLHSPAILANSEWLSYGHTRPAANDAFVYGFASQAGLAIALWILCRLGRTPLFGALTLVVATLFWNLGVTIGIGGVLAGHTTGFEWLEFPRAGSAVMIASYAVIGVCALLTFKGRRTSDLFPSQWYILAALFWFPWLYTTARLLLVWFPVRGVMQYAVNGWFANGLMALWLTSLALAVLYYFIPKLSNAPVHSRTLAVLGFWTLAIFGCWTGFYRGLPIPAWMVSAGIAAAVVMLGSVLSVAANLWLTLGGSGVKKTPLLGFFKTSLIFFVLGSVFAVFAAVIPQLRLTLFGEGTEQIALYGFVGLALFGAIHYIVPRLTDCTSDRFVGANCWATLIGLLLFAGAYLVAGVLQQQKLSDGAIPFVEVMNSSKMFIRMSTMGVLLLVVGNLALLARVISLVREGLRRSGCCSFGDKGVVSAKPVGATR